MKLPLQIPAEQKNGSPDFSFRVLEHIQKSEEWIKAEESFEKLRVMLLKIQGEIRVFA